MTLSSLFRCLFVLLALLALAPGAAMAQSTPRAAAHDTFGRMVFDWDSPVQWSAEVVNGQLVARFEKPIAGDPTTLLRPLSKYLKGVTLSPDRRMATFSLAVPVQVKSFVTGNSTVIDLSESKQPPPPAAAQPAPPTKGEAPAKVAAAPGTPVTDLTVRGGEHNGFNRLVFDWPKPVDYTVSGQNGTVTIAFDRPANLNVTSLEAALPPDVRFVEAHPQGKGTAIVLSVPPGTTTKHFTSGPKIAVDLLRPPPGATPSKTAEAAKPEQQKPEPPKQEPPKPEPAKPETAGANPAPAANGKAAPPSDMAKEVAKAQARPEPPLPPPGNGTPALAGPPIAPPTISGPATAPVAPPPAAAPPPPPPVAAEAPKAPAVSLGVSFDQPAAAAAFRRAGWLWLVFDRKAEVDTKLLKRTGGDVVVHAEQISGVKNGTAVRLITKPGYNPTVRKEGQLWVFDLSEQPMQPRSPLAVNRQFDFEDRGRLILPASDVPPQPVSFRDPEVGDTIQVMPLTTIGAGLAVETVVPGAQLLASAQGVALVPLADGSHLEGNRQGVEVSMPGGLYLSRSLPKVEGGAPVETESAEASMGGPLDISRWNRGGLDKFVPEHQKLMGRMAYVKPEDKNIQRLEVARHYLANGMPAEALGVLRLIAAADPAMLENPAFRGPRGAANFLMMRDGDAIDDLSHPSLAKDPQAQIWLAAAKARGAGEMARQGLLLRLSPDEIKPLTPRLRMALGKVAVQSVNAAGDPRAATRVIEAMNGPGLSKRDMGAISFLQGLTAETGKQWDQAVVKYREAEEGESRPDRAYAARNRIELQLKRSSITAKDAIRQLEKLRFAWRGEDFEFSLLKRLGELMLADGQYAEGLRMLRAIVSNYGDHPDIGSVQAMMSNTFEKLYLGGGADGMPPVQAIGLYDEFQELTPSGAKGDEMIRKLADRLAAVDLLDRAGDLLRHQVQFRLQGVEKARVGARLAFLELSDRKAGLALDSLDMSEVPDQPNDLFDQRRYLRVRALAELGRTAEALALIINDQSETAKQLRAEIYWDLKKWPEAATALEATIDKPEGASPIAPATARRLVDLATALTLARDDRGLARLRRTYGPRMAKTDFKEAFDLLTSEPERGIADYRLVANKIKQVEEFQTFMNNWRQRMQNQGLSSIN
ncbi:MAG: tetratricopeptide repeat protein [Bacteroidales bacterium]